MIIEQINLPTSAVEFKAPCKFGARKSSILISSIHSLDHLLFVCETSLLYIFYQSSWFCLFIKFTGLYSILSVTVVRVGAKMNYE